MMKNVILLMFSLVVLTFTWSCTEEGFDDTLINSNLDSFEQRLDSLENANQGILDSLNSVNTALLDSLAGVAHSADSLGGVSQHILDSIQSLDGYGGPLFMTVTGTYDDGETSFAYTKSKAFSILPYAIEESMSVYRSEYQESEESPIETTYYIYVQLASGSVNSDRASFYIALQEDGTIEYIYVYGSTSFSSTELGSSFELGIYGSSALNEETEELEGEITVNSFSFDLETLDLRIDFECTPSVEQELRTLGVPPSESLENARFTFSDQLVWGYGGD